MSMECELPLGWVWAALCDIAVIQLGKMLSPKAFEANLIQRPYLRNENVRWGYISDDDIKMMGFKESEHDRYSVLPGDLLVCEGGEPGRCAVYKGLPGQYMYQKALHRVRVLADAAEPLYLQYCLQHYALSHTMFPRMSQTTIQHLPLEKMQAVRIPLPPLAEQRRIVAAIEEQFTRLDAGVAALKRARAALKRYRAAVLKAAVEGKLTAPWRSQHPDVRPASELLADILAERRARWEADLRAKGKDPAKAKYDEPQSPQTEGLPELPQGWVWATVEQVTDVGTGATPLRTRSEYYEEGVVPWVTSGALNAERVIEATEFITERAVAETNAKVFPVGTLLMAMYGEGKTRGKVAELAIAAATNQACAAMVFRPASLPVRPYLKHFLLSNYFAIRRQSAGGVQPNLNLTIVKNTTVPLPPLHEQEQIVAEVEQRLSVVSALEATITANLKRAERLRQAILERAFTGRLVPQDPADEPASALLERVRQGRASSAAVAGVRRQAGLWEEAPVDRYP